MLIVLVISVLILWVNCEMVIEYVNEILWNVVVVLVSYILCIVELVD